MSYKVNLRDIEFNLFDYLKVQDLGSTEKYSGMGQDDMGAILKEVLKFCQNEIAPLNKASDQIGCQFKDGKVTTPPGYQEAYQKHAANGFIAMDTPTTYGGMALPLSLSSVAGEFFVGSCIAFSMYTTLTRGAAHLIESFGTEALAQRFVPKMYGGTWGGTMCLTEPQAGSAVGDITTTAIPEGDHYKIKGTKIFISAGDHDLTENIIHLVLARVQGDPAGTKGISLFVVPKFRVNDDGSVGESNDVQTVNIEHKMGIKGSSTCSLNFGDNDGCIGYLVGEAKRGMAMMFQMMNEARLAVGLQGLGLAAAAYESALDYAKVRTQGGNTPIIDYPDVRRMLMFQKSFVEGMRALLLYTSYTEDQNVTSQGDAKQRLQNRVDLLVPVCKAYCTDMSFRVIESALQTYGGYGYISEYPVEQYLRDEKIASIYEGTNGIQALDLIGRKLGQNAGQLFRELYEDLSAFHQKHAANPAFIQEMESFKKTLDQLGQATMKLGEWAMAKNFNLPQLYAVDYLNTLGDVLMSWLLLDHGILALEKLEGIWKAGGATEEAAKAKICEEDDEARFLEGKVKSARFFIHYVLPNAVARVKVILGGNDTVLKVRF